MKNIKKIIFENLNKKYDDIPQEILNRVNQELKLFKPQLIILSNLIDIKDILDDLFIFELNMDINNYTITGSINDLFIAYILGITNHNPLKYKIEIPKQIRVGINLPEGLKELFLKKLKEKYLEKAKMLKNQNYFVIDNDNELKSINNNDYPDIIDMGKNEINLKNNILIYIDEKIILTILNSIYKYNNFNIKYDKKTIDLLNSKIYSTYHKTAYEYNINCKFKFHFLDHYKKSFELTYFKYFYPRVYYYEVIKYLIKKLDKKELYKYKNNFDKAIYEYENKERNLFEEEVFLEFYKICKDAKNVIPSFILDTSNLLPIIKNITFLEHRVGNGLIEVLNKIILNNNNVLIFNCDGSNEWYVAKLLEKESKVDYKEIISFINPLIPNKVISKNIKKITEAILKYQKDNIYINSYFYNDSLEEIINTSQNYNVIIINSFDYFLKKTKYSLQECLEKLNQLNKEIIILEKPKNKYKIEKEIIKDEIKYLKIKLKYAEKIYCFQKINNEIKIKELL